jgi:hypothetical protein
LITRAAVVFALLLAALTLATPVVAQPPIPCPVGSGHVTPARVGTDVIQEGQGLGAARIGAALDDVLRAWGGPYDCLSQPPAGWSLSYGLSDAPNSDSMLLVVVRLTGRTVEGVLVSMLPHARARPPAVKTARGVAILGSMQDAVRAYGLPDGKEEETWLFTSHGVAVAESDGHVMAIIVFRPGGRPPWLPPRAPVEAPRK